MSKKSEFVKLLEESLTSLDMTKKFSHDQELGDMAEFLVAWMKTVVRRGVPAKSIGLAATALKNSFSIIYDTIPDTTEPMSAETFKVFDETGERRVREAMKAREAAKAEMIALLKALREGSPD